MFLAFLTVFDSGEKIKINNDNFKEIMEKYSNLVYKLCYLNLKNTSDAEDALQEVFFKLYSVHKAFENEEHLKAWLLKVTSNHCKNIIKSNKKMSYSEIEDIFTVSDNYESLEFSDIISALPDNYKEIVFLYYYCGYKINQIARIQNTNENTVKTKLSRARKFLKDSYFNLKGESYEKRI